jgi:hypothetical protein
MNNQNTIEQIRQETSGILEKLGDRQISEFKIKDLDIDNGVYLRGMPVKGKALNEIMYVLKVRNNFTDMSQKLSPSDWSFIASKLKTAEADTKMYGRIVKDDHGNPEVVHAFKHNDKKKHTDDAAYRQYFNWIEESLGTSEIDYSVKGLNFNSKTETFDLVLLNERDRVDVFNTDLDLWKMGERFTFSGLQFNYAPFFERLVCSNGNTATEYGFGARISQAKFNNRRIQTVIEKSLVHGSETLPEQLVHAVQHLKNNNISMLEFYQYRNFFDRRNSDEKYNGLITRYFDDQPFFKSYGMDINGKSRKWKSTANTGINAYDFFNQLTWIASHPEEVRMDREDRMQLQIEASHLLFKKELDLEDIASQVHVDYPRLAIMN